MGVGQLWQGALSSESKPCKRKTRACKSVGDSKCGTAMLCLAALLQCPLWVYLASPVKHACIWCAQAGLELGTVKSTPASRAAHVHMLPALCTYVLLCWTSLRCL